MRSGVTLATLREEVMIEARLSTQGGHATYTVARLNQFINRTERFLYDEHEWPLEHLEETVTVAADARYTTLPSTIPFTQVETVDVLYGDQYLPVKYGIGARERSIYDADERAEPITRWEIQQDNPTQFEVWPIGQTAQTLLFQGRPAIGAMVNESDTCALDADVIVARVAARILGKDNQADAQLLLQEAEQRVQTLMKKQGASKRDNPNMGRRRRPMLRPGIDYIPPGGG